MGFTGGLLPGCWFYTPHPVREMLISIFQKLISSPLGKSIIFLKANTEFVVRSSGRNSQARRIIGMHPFDHQSLGRKRCASPHPRCRTRDRSQSDTAMLAVHSLEVYGYSVRSKVPAATADRHTYRVSSARSEARRLSPASVKTHPFRRCGTQTNVPRRRLASPSPRFKLRLSSVLFRISAISNSSTVSYSCTKRVTAVSMKLERGRFSRSATVLKSR